MSESIEDQTRETLVSRVKALDELCCSQSLKRTELESQLTSSQATIELIEETKTTLTKQVMEQSVEIEEFKATIDELKKEKFPDWLLEMSKQMNEQDNRCTANPIFQVRCKEYVITEEGYNDHHFEIACVDDGDSVWSSTSDPQELFDYLMEYKEEWCEEYILEDHDSIQEGLEYWYSEGVRDLPSNLRMFHMQEVEKVVSTHLTEADANWFIKRKQHDYPKLYTYVESAYWSPQLKKLQDWIISLSITPPNS